MNERERNRLLRELARGQSAAPLCDAYYTSWSDDKGIDDLLSMFVEGQNFCIINNYPTLDFIHREFDVPKEVLHSHGIYLDEDVDISAAPNGTYVFLGNCSGVLRFNYFAAATVYLRHSSELKIVADCESRIILIPADSSDFEIEKDEWSSVRVIDKRR